MPPLFATSSSNVRSSHTLRANDIVEVKCHRIFNGVEEFLVRWRSNPTTPCPPGAMLSWHPLPELDDALHHVQDYLEIQNLSKREDSGLSGLGDLPANRKRKSPDVEPEPSRDLIRNGLLTPGDSFDRSRSPSVNPDAVTNNEKGKEPVLPLNGGPRVYNGILQKKGGRIVPKSFRKLPETARADVVKVNATTLPTPAMQHEASNTKLTQTEKVIRLKFLEMLKPVKGVQLENLVDTTTPSLNFTFIDSYELMEGIYAQPAESYEGCVKRCKPNMGQNIGCEYTQHCECLEYAHVDEAKLEKRDPELYAKYRQQVDSGLFIDTMGLPKRFPYSMRKSDAPGIPQTLVQYYRETRNPIYECNDNCKCGPICKSRVVQKGRRVPLTIFKTENRGWGVYCNEDLVAGEFIDTYLGEVITNEEADRREKKAGKVKNSYSFDLDKFVGDAIDGGEVMTQEEVYVVDGQYMGGPTRFINHSCEPNCRQYSVSYNKNDWRLYNLAFFAYENIKAGTELTFDYLDHDEQEEEDAIRRREEAMRDPENEGKIPCNCGTTKCRGFLW